MNREETQPPYYYSYCSVPHQYVQQQYPVIQQPTVSYPFINYNRAKPWVWFVAAISGIIGCYGLAKKFINLGFMIKNGYKTDAEPDMVLAGEFLGMLLFSIEIFIGVCLFIALNNNDPKSTLAYCNAWLYGTYVLNTFTVLFILAMFQESFNSKLYAPVITYIAYRIIAYFIVKTFIGDLRKFLDQKEFVAQSHRRVLMAANPHYFSQFNERTAAYHHEPRPDLVSEPTGMEAWVAWSIARTLK